MENCFLLTHGSMKRNSIMDAPEAVDAEVKEILAKAGKNPCGFVLASGCEVPIETSPENIFAMMNAARKYGQHPLS